MSPRVITSGVAKGITRSRSESESETGAFVGRGGPEARRAILGQAEAPVTRSGGPNRSVLKNRRMT